jgi:hypothetical protein
VATTVHAPCQRPVSESLVVIGIVGVDVSVWAGVGVIVWAIVR